MSDTPPPPPYGEPTQPNSPYGGPPYGGQAVQDHPQSTMILVLGILGLVLCQVLGPIAWVMGNRALAEIDASGGTMGGRSNVNIGRILGIVGTVLLVLSLLIVVAAIFIVVLSAANA